MFYATHSPIILRSGLWVGHSMPCKSVSSIYSFTMRALSWGHYHLETHSCHLGNDVQITGQTKLSMTSIYFWALNITVNNCQSTHTFKDVAPDHQTYTNTTTWIQAWWSPFFASSLPNKYMVVHSQFYLTFITIYMYHLLPVIISNFVPIQCQQFF